MDVVYHHLLIFAQPMPTQRKKIINCGQKTFQCQKPVLELIDSLQSTNTRLLVCDDLSSFLNVSVKEIIDLFTAQGCFL